MGLNKTVWIKSIRGLEFKYTCQDT
jgi:hypothetical protein